MAISPGVTPTSFFYQAVLDLKARDGRCAAQFRDGRGAGDTPGREIGEARIEDLAGSNKVAEAAHDLLDRRDTIGIVHPIEIDAVRLEPLQARFDRETMAFRLLPVARMPS